MLVYFVLKDASNSARATVKVEKDRASSSCPCLLVLRDGATVPLGEGETVLPREPLGAILLENGQPLAYGTMPGVTLTRQELWYRVKQRLKPQGSPPPAAPEPAPKEETPPQEAAADEREEQAAQGVAPEQSAAAAADFGLLVSHAGAVYEGILHPPLPEPELEPVSKDSPRDNWLRETDRLIRSTPSGSRRSRGPFRP